MKLNPFTSLKSKWKIILPVVLILILVVICGVLIKQDFNQKSQIKLSQTGQTSLTYQLAQVQTDLQKTKQDLTNLQNQDQVKINQNLEAEIKNIHDSYLGAMKTYENIMDLRDEKQDTKKLDPEFAQILQYLADKNYASASATLTDLNNQITSVNQQLANAAIAQKAAQAPVAPVSNTPPSSGYSQQKVQSDEGTFAIDIVSADLNSTKVIIDTASDSDCSNNCPVLPLSTYVSRSGAYAGINGAFFCPASYPSCAGKTNSFDTLLMNKNKVYFNSANNVYSTIPAAIFSAGSARFVSQSLQWGRDTSPDAVIANYPMLVQGGNIVYSGSSDPKLNSVGARCFIGNKGSTVYIGCVLGATTDNAAHVLKALGLDNALNLDEGGSTALWSGGYKLGPGRDLPDAVLFVKR